MPSARLTGYGCARRALLALAALAAFAAATSAAQAAPPKPAIEPARSGTQCVEDTATMRRSYSTTPRGRPRRVLWRLPFGIRPVPFAPGEARHPFLSQKASAA